MDIQSARVNSEEEGCACPTWNKEKAVYDPLA
jgi:hypothetical protein